jgi:hypothetical protein
MFRFVQHDSMKRRRGKLTVPKPPRYLLGVCVTKIVVFAR